jgi:hypothetical protein
MGVKEIAITRVHRIFYNISKQKLAYNIEFHLFYFSALQTLLSQNLHCCSVLPNYN